MTRILQFGSTGQLARELVARAPRGVALTALSRAQADLTDPDACAGQVAAARPNVVIIAAAMTAVDQAETDRETAFRVNAEAPGAIAHAAADVGAAVVHVSTDYVFDGASARPYAEADTPNPLSVYGASKLAGERAVLAANPRAAVIRTAALISPHGRNFATTMLRLAREGRPISVVEDQLASPTAAGDLADFILATAPGWAAAKAGARIFGLTHYAGSGAASWREVAQAILHDAYGDAAPKVTATTASARAAPARRPDRAILDTNRLAEVFAVTPRLWREAVADVVRALAPARTESAA
jgi:dTDP-4-dehydrorhamnose reductase